MNKDTQYKSKPLCNQSKSIHEETVRMEDVNEALEANTNRNLWIIRQTCRHEERYPKLSRDHHRSERLHGGPVERQHSADQHV